MPERASSNDLLEDAAPSATSPTVVDDALRVDYRPFEIMTFRVTGLIADFVDRSRVRML